MALVLSLCSNGLTSSPCVSQPSSSSSLILNAVPSIQLLPLPISRLSLKTSNIIIPNSCVRICFGGLPIGGNKRGTLIVKASSDIIPDGGKDYQSESDDEDDEDFPGVNELPLDSKLQNKLEKKLKMKIAKKIRLRRKKLVHKRGLRKKGRWPPSKMKKLSHV